MKKIMIVCLVLVSGCAETVSYSPDYSNPEYGKKIDVSYSWQSPLKKVSNCWDKDGTPCEYVLQSPFKR